ncbi:MAG: hypothetical protein NC816_00780 [Candidatus Omnitrophica bacterium]|nr:hypothetical protein [Candidatus Omnitrophota bacterium]
MTKKLYASQWMKITGKTSEESSKLKEKLFAQLDDKEIKLLFDLSRSVEYAPSVGYCSADLAELAVNTIGIDRTLNILNEQKDGRTMLSLLRKRESNLYKFHKKLIENILDYGIKERDYDTLLLLGRHIVMHYPKYLNKYVKSMLPLLKEYKYGEGKPANPVSCLAYLSPEVEVKVKRYMKYHKLTDALKRWKEYTTRRS